jgi:hypothetical protein
MHLQLSLFFVPIFSTAIYSCGQAKFSGDESSSVAKNPPQACTETKSSVAPNIAFIIDNSGSNGSRDMSTDCPGIKLNPDGSATCSEPTMREIAVQKMIRTLKDFSAKDPANPLSAANIAVSAYPRTTFTAGHNAWKSVSKYKDDLSDVDQLMAFTRSPGGDTPLQVGMSAANSLLEAADKSNSRRTVIIFVTDGFPNDRNVSETVSMATSLKEKTEVYVVMNTNGSNYQERRGSYVESMSKRWHSGTSSYATPSMTQEEYFSTMIGNNENEGVMNVLADKQFFADSAIQVPDLLEQIVSSTTQQCP